ncbi:MAG: PASTA domain-containing protein [Prevotella sp.]|jgi:beta-lactam-binding protein with PASTA domain|nr:PASTA domain-containing protein [Prevotella sp.]
MKAKDFFGKFTSRYLWGHLTAMLVVLILIGLGVKFGLAAYTRHGEGIKVPDLYGTDFKKALVMLEEKGLTIIVNDSGYNKRMPANCILTQTPAAGNHVKEGRTIFVTVNSTASPSVAIPDLIDNSSYREAQARLTAIGFRLLPPKRIDGEQDWLYGIQCGGRSLHTGDMVSIESPLTLIIGNGTYEEEDEMMLFASPDGEGMSDDFMEVDETTGNDEN